MTGEKDDTLMKKTEEKNTNEIKEGLRMLRQSPDDVLVLNMTFGDYVIFTKELFDDIVHELNHLRIQHGNLEDGIEVAVEVEKEDD